MVLNATTKKLHGVTSQKVTIFIVTAVRTSNLTFVDILKNTERSAESYIVRSLKRGR